MPLNVDEEGHEKESAPESSAAVDGGSARPRRAILTVSVVVAIALAVWFAIRSGIVGGGDAGGGRDVPAAGGPERAGEVNDAGGGSTGAGAGPTSGTPDGSRAAGQAGSPAGSGAAAGGAPAPAADAGGRYTIFIAAFTDEGDARELADRWERAGYPAFVQQSSRWHRVGLGRYGSIEEARAEAEGLRHAFEQGYWIGPANP